MTAKPDAESRFVLMTPAWARQLLRSNWGNRPLRPSGVDEYVRIIETNAWTLSNDAICIAPNGRLLNGQHRLNAIIKTNKSVWINLIENMPEEAFKNIDRQRRRTRAESLGEPASLIADTQLILALVLAQRVTPTQQEVQDACEMWRPAWKALAGVGYGDSRKRLNTVPVRVGVGLRWATSGPRQRPIVLSYARMLVADSDDMPKAVRSLWARIIEQRAKESGGTQGRLERAWAVFHHLDPSRNDVKPLVRSVSEGLATLRGWARMMSDAFAAGPDQHGHPYLWPGVPKVERKLAGIAAEKLANKRAREAAAQEGRLF